MNKQNSLKRKYKKKYIELKRAIQNTIMLQTELNSETNNGSDKELTSIDDYKNKILGSIYGVCVGDALGSRYEFLENSTAIEQIIEDVKKNGNKLQILGGGPFNIIAGQVTDDTEMTLCLLKSLADKGFYDQEDVALKYIEWYNSGPVDIGKTISRTLFTRKKSLNNIDMIINSNELNKSSLSNGTLMRIVPLALYGTRISTKDLQGIIAQECELTHPNPIIKDLCYLYCVAVKYVISGIDKLEIIGKLRKIASTARSKIILNDAINYPEPTYMIDEYLNETYINTDDKKYQGYIGIAMQNALYELIYGTSFDKSMIDIIKRGGDVDTNCAIAGGLLGAYYGYNKIDTDWINTVKNAKVDRYEKYPNYSPQIIDKSIKKLFGFK